MAATASKGLVRLAAVLERAPAPPTESPFSSLARPRRAETPDPLCPSAPDNDYEQVNHRCSIEVHPVNVDDSVIDSQESKKDSVVSVDEETHEIPADTVTDVVVVEVDEPVLVVDEPNESQPETLPEASSSVYPDLDSRVEPTPQVERLGLEEEEEDLSWRGEKRAFDRGPSGLLLPPPLWSSPPPNYSALDRYDLDPCYRQDDERFGSQRRCFSSPQLNLPLPPAPGRLTFPAPLLTSTPAVEATTGDDEEDEERVTLHPSLRRHVHGLMSRVGTVPSLTEKKRVQFQIEALVAHLSQTPGHALSYEGSDETLSEDGLNQTVVADVHSPPPLSDQACVSSPDRAPTGSLQPASWMMTPKPGHPRLLTKRLENSRGEMPALTTHYLRSLSRPKFHQW